ncbi:MAG: hypothetical protein RQ885_00670 [Desulfurococcales archaeon]|jgi:hypothetical protein|nr:hypothetical protein [Desulfurococcales archaeon]
MGAQEISEEPFLSLFAYLDKFKNLPNNTRDLLLRLAWKLYDLNRKKSISINHSIMEILVASYLLERGYSEVDVEASVGELVADVVASRGGLRILVEIETGFTPADHSADPIEYLRARIASKIARYSPRSDIFALAFPIYYIPPIPYTLLKPPSKRSVEELVRLVDMINQYYKNPPIDIEDLTKAKIDELYILYVDRGFVIRINPEDIISSHASLCNGLDLYRYLFGE